MLQLNIIHQHIAFALYCGLLLAESFVTSVLAMNAFAESPARRALVPVSYFTLIAIDNFVRNGFPIP